jgi:SPX domain protein involved in polyphosphate accumulation
VAVQGFIRSTQKFWVRSRNVSDVKYTILQHLPVFRFNPDPEEEFPADAQLTNSVYLDNSLGELYHGRLDKRPDAIAIRLRWYGSGDPKLVFVERKTHREGWKGEVSVKERFALQEKYVIPFLENRYKVEEVCVLCNSLVVFSARWLACMCFSQVFPMPFSAPCCTPTMCTH